MAETNENRYSPLTGKVVKGAGWMFCSKAAERSLTLVKILVLARLLSPHDFGLFGILVLTVSALESLSKTGIRRALVQRSKLTNAHLDAGWTFLLLRELGVYILLLLVAAPVASFFDVPSAVPLLRAMAIFAPLRGLQNIGTIFFERELEFHKRFILEVTAAASGLATGLILALWLRSAWALVFGSLAAEAARTLLSYLLHSYRPHMTLGRDALGDLLHFGKWIFASSTLVFIAGHLDDAVVGKVIGASALGIYQIGFKISDMPISEFGQTLARVLFPAYARIQHDRRRLGTVYLTVLENIMFVVLPVAAFMGFYAPQIVHYTVGENWTAAVPLIRILAPAAALKILNSTTATVYHGAGKTNYGFWKNVIRIGVLAVLIVPFSRAYGTAGACWAFFLSNAAILPPAFYFLWRITGLSPLLVLRYIVRPVIAAALLVLPYIAIGVFAPELPYGTLGGAAAGLLLFVAFGWVVKGKEIKTIFALLLPDGI